MSHYRPFLAPNVTEETLSKMVDGLLESAYAKAIKECEAVGKRCRKKYSTGLAFQATNECADAIRAIASKS